MSFLLMVVVQAGCSQDEATTTGSISVPAELSLAEQVAQVEMGESDTLLVESQPVSDGDLAKWPPLPRLTTIQLDHEGCAVTAEGLKELQKFPHLAHLRIRGGKLDDGSLRVIAEMPSLKILNLPRGQFTDAGLRELKRLPKLVQLRIGSPGVTDEGLKALQDFPALRRLHLIGVSMSDSGLLELQKLKKLESLYLDDVEVSDQGIEQLIAARPDLHLHLNQRHHDRDPQKGTHSD